MVDFNEAVSIVIDLEGGAKLVSDSGGLTKYGISQRAYPDLGIENLTLAKAKKIYYKDYWKPTRCDELVWPLNLVLFDTAVNQGPKTAVKLLQRAAKDLAIDGVFGPKTLERVNYLDPVALSTVLLSERAIRYMGTKHFDRYGRGWLNRLFRLASRY